MLKDGVRSSRCTTIGERAYTPNIKTVASTAQTALDSTRVTPASNPSPLFFAKGLLAIAFPFFVCEHSEGETIPP